MTISRHRLLGSELSEGSSAEGMTLRNSILHLGPFVEIQDFPGPSSHAQISDQITTAQEPCEIHLQKLTRIMTHQATVGARKSQPHQNVSSESDCGRLLPISEWNSQQRKGLKLVGRVVAFSVHFKTTPSLFSRRDRAGLSWRPAIRIASGKSIGSNGFQVELLLVAEHHAPTQPLIHLLESEAICSARLGLADRRTLDPHWSTRNLPVNHLCHQPPANSCGGRHKTGLQAQTQNPHMIENAFGAYTKMNQLTILEKTT